MGWYDRVSGTPVPQPVQQMPQMTGMQFQNPIQRAQAIMQAMANPAAFVKQHFPDIPDELLSNPGRLLQALQQAWGVPNQQIQQLANQYPGRRY